MYIQSVRLHGLILFVFNLAFVVKALPSSHFKSSIRDDLGAIGPETEPSSEGLDSTLLDADIFSSGPNLNSPDGSIGLLASASVQTDSVQPLLPDSDQIGTDTASSGQSLPFDNLGPASKPEEFSLPDDTLELGDTSSDHFDLASSPALFVGDDPDGSSSTLAYIPSDLLAPKDKLLPEGGSIPDPSEDAFLSEDDKLFDSIDPAENAYLPEGDTLFDSVGPVADTYLSAGIISDSASPAEDNSFGLYDTEGTLVASREKATVEGSTTTPTCSGRKVAACCSTRSSGAFHDYKTECTECMCVLIFSIAYLSYVLSMALGELWRKEKLFISSV